MNGLTSAFQQVWNSLPFVSVFASSLDQSNDFEQTYFGPDLFSILPIELRVVVYSYLRPKEYINSQKICRAFTHQSNQTDTDSTNTTFTHTELDAHIFRRCVLQTPEFLAQKPPNQCWRSFIRSHYSSHPILSIPNQPNLKCRLSIEGKPSLYVSMCAGEVTWGDTPRYWRRVNRNEVPEFDRTVNTSDLVFDQFYHCVAVCWLNCVVRNVPLPPRRYRISWILGLMRRSSIQPFTMTVDLCNEPLSQPQKIIERRVDAEERNSLVQSCGYPVSITRIPIGELDISSPSKINCYLMDHTWPWKSSFYVHGIICESV